MFGSSEVYRSRPDVFGHFARSPPQTFSDVAPGKGLIDKNQKQIKISKLIAQWSLLSAWLNCVWVMLPRGLQAAHRAVGEQKTIWNFVFCWLTVVVVIADVIMAIMVVMVLMIMIFFYEYYYSFLK